MRAQDFIFFIVVCCAFIFITGSADLIQDFTTVHTEKNESEESMRENSLEITSEELQIGSRAIIFGDSNIIPTPSCPPGEAWMGFKGCREIDNHVN